MSKPNTSKLLLETPIFNVTDNWLNDPAGNRIRRIMVEHNGSTAVVPVDDQGRVCLVRQYRYPAKQYMLELPGGVIDPGETALRAAKRELEEETGLKAKKWKKLIKFYPSAGFQQESMTLFLAQGLSEGTIQRGEDEHLEVKWYACDWVEEQIRKGRIVDAKTIVGMYFYLRLCS